MAAPGAGSMVPGEVRLRQRPPGPASRNDAPGKSRRCTVHRADSYSGTVHGAPRRSGGGRIVPVVTLLNQKGGVGKTSCTHHLAGTLAQSGRRVLLLDNDPQSSLTQGYWGPVATRDLDPGETIAALYRGDRPFPEQVIKASGIEGIDLVPGSRYATDFNV